MPMSCCRRRSRWSARISAPPPATRCWSRCIGRWLPMARRATITTSSPVSPSGSASARNSPRAVRRGIGSSISMARHAVHFRRAASPHRISMCSGKRGSCCCRPCRGTAASSAPFAEIPRPHRCRRRAARSRSPLATIQSFDYEDCPGHPTWLPPSEGAGSPAMARFPLQLVANQPATRLHSQLDFGATSLASKVKGREPVRIHPQDAAARGITDGDIVRLYNDRGACLAGAVLSEALRPGVVQLSTGAWYDPEDPERGKAGLRARQSERADARCRHVPPRAGLHGTALFSRDRALRGAAAPNKGIRSTAEFNVIAGAFAGERGYPAVL